MCMDEVTNTSTTPITSLLDRYQGMMETSTKGKKTERGDLLDAFLKELNPPRIINGMKPLKVPYLSMKFSEAKMTTPQIYQFYKECEKANNFSSYFWWAMKPK